MYRCKRTQINAQSHSTIEIDDLKDDGRQLDIGSVNLVLKWFFFSLNWNFEENLQPRRQRVKFKDENFAAKKPSPKLSWCKFKGIQSQFDEANIWKFFNLIFYYEMVAESFKESE